MSLKQLPLRIRGALRPQSTRPFSTTPQCSQAEAILDALKPVSWAKKYNVLDDSKKRKRSNEETRLILERDDYGQQLHRKWQPGDVYAPHDLTGREQAKWAKAQRQGKGDAVDTLGINPLHEYKNFTIMSEFMTEMGRIKHSKLTGLRPVNQRKMAKAIRRAIGLGLMPSVHRHPLALKNHRPGRFA